MQGKRARIGKIVEGRGCRRIRNGKLHSQSEIVHHGNAEGRIPLLFIARGDFLLGRRKRGFEGFLHLVLAALRLLDDAVVGIGAHVQARFLIARVALLIFLELVRVLEGLALVFILGFGNDSFGVIIGIISPVFI